MFLTYIKIAVVVLLTLAAYTLLANMIPQIESEVPEELDLSGDFSIDMLVAAGERTYSGAGGCTACHGLGTRAPNLLTGEGGLGSIGARCAEREPGTDCKAYLYSSLTEPGAYVVEGYNPIMPDARRTLSENQIWALVAYLESLGGEVTVRQADISEAAMEPAPAMATGSALAAPATSEPRELLVQLGCLACHKLGEEGNALGPALSDVGARRDADYIRRSILDPAADVSPGYEALAAMMPADFGDRLTAAQLEALVRFLAELR